MNERGYVCEACGCYTETVFESSGSVDQLCVDCAKDRARLEREMAERGWQLWATAEEDPLR